MTANRSELILKQTTKLLTKKALNCGPCYHFKNEICEMGHHQQNLILTVQFLKSDQCPLCCVAVRFSGTLVQPVNCEFFFTWIAVLRRQVDAKTVNLFLISCLDLVHLHKYFCQYLIFLLLLFNFFQSTRYKRKFNAFFRNLFVT